MTQRKCEYDTYKEVFNRLDIANIDGGKQIFKGGDSNLEKLKDTSPVLLSTVYTLLYIHRNRNAHNTTSYQENLPDLTTLVKIDTQRYSNIFLYITILIIIDELYIRVYKDFIDKINLL